MDGTDMKADLHCQYMMKMVILSGIIFFYAIMLMRRAQDQKMYLYDIIQIKKEMRNLF